MARVLVIEDNAINLELMNFMLQAWQHEVLQAGDGETGLALARSERPDIILCDLQMPGIDGHGVAKALSADARLSQIPLLALTALARDSDRAAALASGFDGVFTKPIDPPVFMAGLHAFLLDPPPSPLSPLPAREAPVLPAIPAGLCAPRRPCVLLTVDDGPSNVAYKRDLLEPAGYTVWAASSVSEALALLQREVMDMVVSDVVMGEGGGFELLRLLKAHPAWRELPFVFLTSSARDAGSQELALALGAQAYLLRPLDAFALLGELRRVLQGASG